MLPTRVSEDKRDSHLLRRVPLVMNVVEAVEMQQQLVEEDAAAVTLTKRWGVVWRR